MQIHATTLDPGISSSPRHSANTAPRRGYIMQKGALKWRAFVHFSHPARINKVALIQS